MFTVPPYPPKDYVLKDVPKLQRDSPQFSPESGPRVTQTTFGVFCSPVEYKEGESPSEKIEVLAPSPLILEKWANEARAWWISKPGQDDFFLHDLYNKYNVQADSYNPNSRQTEKIFNRPYKYELECLKARRLEKLRNKCKREEWIRERDFRTVEKREQDERHPPMKVLGCGTRPPFWWQRSTINDVDDVGYRKIAKAADEKEETEPSGRWAKEPCLTAFVADDPCRRKYDMQLVGQPFKTEACNFYYTNYPPPHIKFRPKRFA